MGKGEQTRQEIIRKAASIFNQRGYDRTALSDLMRATGARWHVLVLRGILMANGERSQSRTKHGEMMSSPESRFKPDHETQLKGDGVGVAHPMGSESKQAVDTTTQTRAESLLAAAKRTLGMIAGSPSLTDILENLCGAIALYLNVFVLIVRLFEKVPGLKTMAPALSEPPFKAFRAGDFRPAWHFRRKVVRQRTSPYGLTRRIGFSRWVRGLAPN